MTTRTKPLNPTATMPLPHVTALQLKTFQLLLFLAHTYNFSLIYPLGHMNYCHDHCVYLSMKCKDYFI